MVNSPKWKIEAASTALAWPSRTPSTRCSSVPTPPEATTGTGHAVGDGAREREIVARLGAVAIHRGQEDFARAERRHLLGEGERVDARRLAARHG